MGEISLKINGEEYTAEEGETILEVANRNDINIPTHCYNEAFEPSGACRICLVEVDTGKGNPQLEPACSYPVVENLIVETESERVKKARKLTAELLLARCPNSEEVKKLASELGVEEFRFSPKNLNCTLCRLCIKACKAATGDNVIVLSGRGPNLEILTPFELSEEGCKGCGACAEICPTNVIEMVEIEE